MVADCLMRPRHYQCRHRVMKSKQKSRTELKNKLLKIKIVQKRFKICLKSQRDVRSFSSAGRTFQAARAAEAEKARSPSLSRIDRMIKSPLFDERIGVLEGTSVVAVRSLDMYSGARLVLMTS